MGCLWKLITFIPKLILGIIFNSLKKIFCCIMALLLMLILFAAIILFIITQQ